MNIDDAFAAAEKLFQEVEPRLDAIESEQDARLQLINRMLTEVLGWAFADIRTEPPSESGYTDYLLSVGGVPSLVIEAKRTGKILLNTASQKPTIYTVGGPSLKAASDGVAQAASYCLDQGVDFAILTTGVVWVAFLAFSGGGKPYREGKAVVFPSFDAIRDDFARFHDLVSKPGVHERLYKVHLAKAGGLAPANFEPLVAANRASDLKQLPKSQLAQDLDPLFKGFFSKMSGDSDKVMLLECFVESRESRNADVALQKMIGNVADHVSVISTDTGEQLVEQIEAVVETGLGENVLIVGNKGAGKSTFIERFFESVLDRSIKAKCITVNIDLLDSTGEASTIAPWLTDKVCSALQEQLFSDGIPQYDELQGLYYKEYQQWRIGQHKHLYETNKTEFKIKFGQFLDERMNTDPFGYVLRLLNDIVNNRHLLPCFVFDNTDHFAETFQESVFQWSQALHKQVQFSLVILPITDRTIWRLSKSGPFQTYESKTFYLPVPSTKEILRKRIAYLKMKADDSSTHTYFLAKGIRLSMENISAFARAVEEIFISEDFVSRRIGWLCNHDMRRTLGLSQDVMTSPYLSIDDLIAAYLKRGEDAPAMTISYRKFMQALVSRTYNQFQSTENPYVLNMFEVSSDFPSTPLLRTSVLKLLIDKAGEEGGDAGYAPIDQLFLYFEAMGLTAEAVGASLGALLDYRLIEPFDASADDAGPKQRVAITHSGRMHYEMVQTDPIYVAQMAFATPVRSMAVVERLRKIKTGKMKNEQWAEVRRAFILYCFAEDRSFIRLPRDAIYDGQRQLRSDLFGKWGGRQSEGSGDASDDFPQPVEGSAAASSHVLARVKWYDQLKGFGFLDGGMSSDIFLHARTLKAAGLDHVSEDDRIVVDVADSGGGRLQAIQFHSIEARAPVEPSARDFVPAEVKFYNESNGYGFLIVEGIDEDVYVSYQVLQRSGLATLTTGDRVGVIVGDYIPRRGWAAVLLQQ